MIVLRLLLLVLLIAPVPAASDIFKWTDPQGLSVGLYHPSMPVFNLPVLNALYFFEQLCQRHARFTLPSICEYRVTPVY